MSSYVANPISDDPISDSRVKIIKVNNYWSLSALHIDFFLLLVYSTI